MKRRKPREQPLTDEERAEAGAAIAAMATLLWVVSHAEDVAGEINRVGEVFRGLAEDIERNDHDALA